MKKIILALFLFLFIAGCSYGNNLKYNEENAPDGLANYDPSDVLTRVNELKDGRTPEMKPDKNNSTTNQNNMETEQPNQIQLEPLSDQYGQAVVKTNFGDIKLAFYATESPLTVNNFLNLANKGFYNGTKFHRVMPDFMIQGGDPNSKDDDWSNDGLGGPGYQFQDEINNHKLVRGSLAMANSGANTNGSQFFIVTAEATPWLDGQHTNFGYVVDGMEIVDKIEAVNTNENDHPTEDVIIESIELLE
jgi:cyclophilin family peptidyl-prolyl cis-trans isomerase